MTKAEHIRKLYADGLSDREIAEIVDCTDSYVRVCARQRINGSSSEADARYLKKRFETNSLQEARRRQAAEAYTYAWVREKACEYSRKYSAKKRAERASCT